MIQKNSKPTTKLIIKNVEKNALVLLLGSFLAANSTILPDFSGIKQSNNSSWIIEKDNQTTQHENIVLLIYPMLIRDLVRIPKVCRCSKCAQTQASITKSDQENRILIVNFCDLKQIRQT